MSSLRLVSVMLIPTLLSGCLYGQCMEGMCTLERERYLNSIKAYGEYWTKPEMTRESWRQDWVDCGGLKNGQYLPGPRLPGETGDIAAASRRGKSLGACMQSKGYTYRYTGP